MLSEKEGPVDTPPTIDEPLSDPMTNTITDPLTDPMTPATGPVMPDDPSGVVVDPVTPDSSSQPGGGDIPAPDGTYDPVSTTETDAGEFADESIPF